MIEKTGIIKSMPLYILVFLNILSGGLSILPLYFIYDSVALINIFVGSLNFLWCIIHANNRSHIQHLPAFIICYLLIIFYQIFTGWFSYSSTVLYLQVSFILLLIKIYSIYKREAFNLLSNVYVIYSLANVVCTITAFILLVTNVIDLTSHPLDLNTFTKSDDLAYFPGYLTVFRPKDVLRTGFIPIEGMLCGFSHEPHVVGYLCIPALFILINKLKSYKRVIVILLYSFFILLTASTTSLIVVPLVFLIAILLNPQQFGKYKIVSYMVIGLFVIFVILNQAFFLDNFGFFIDKAQDSGEDSSMASSINYIKYALSPKTLIGSNIYGFTGDMKHGDVGVFTALMNLIVYVSCFLFALKMIKCKSKIVFWNGLAFLYFLFHSLKGMLLIYQFPYALLLMFMSYIVYQSNGTNILSKEGTIKVSNDTILA